MGDFPFGHVLLSSASAGPIVVVVPTLGAIASDPSHWSRSIAVAPLILMFAIPIGFVIALIPNMIGTASLRWLGGRYRAGRHPLVWIAAGFAIAWSMSASFFGSIDIGNMPLGVVGAICAGICRWGMIWAD